MKNWSTACPDWEDRLIKGRPLIPLRPLFPKEAAAALSVFDELRIVDAPGSPTMGEACAPWIRDFVGAVFGAYDHSIGRRLITEFFLLIAKKNSKSTTAAGIMLTALIKNWRRSAEFLIVAPTIEVANNSFYPARDMVKSNPELQLLFHVQEHFRTITHRGNGATLKVVAADNESVGGKKATGVLVDELWLFGRQPNAENMLREATGGLASRKEGFVIYLSTQSDAPPAGVFKSKLHYARGVRDGRLEDKKFLPVLYEFPKALIEDSQVPERKYWRITNPNLGSSVDGEYLDHEYQKAQDAGLESLAGFLAKHLNIEIGLRLQSDHWPGAEFWRKQGRKDITLDDILKNCEVVDIGIDGGGLDDLLGINVIGRVELGRGWLSWAHAWAHPSVLERRKSEAARLRDFAKQGDLTIVEKIGDDVDQVADIVGRVYKAGLLDKVGVDPVGIGQVLDALVALKIPQEKIVGISQGWKLSGAIKTAERKLAEGALLHADMALMDWCVGNAKIEPKGNATLITKQVSGAAKIDPLMAMFNAVSLMALNPPSAKKRYQIFSV